MDVIDGEWIKRRLDPTKRGQKAALARAMGIEPDKLSRVLTGERNVQPDEIGSVLRFFGEKLDPTMSSAQSDIAEIIATYDRLSPDAQAYLRRTVEILQYLVAQERARAAGEGGHNPGGVGGQDH